MCYLIIKDNSRNLCIFLFLFQENMFSSMKPRRAYSPAAVSAHSTHRTHCHLCPTRYSFSPESSEAFEGGVPCPRTEHLSNVPRLRGEKHDISLKILHQAGFETARQAATLAERHTLTIGPCPSLNIRKLYISNQTKKAYRSKPYMSICFAVTEPSDFYMSAMHKQVYYVIHTLLEIRKISKWKNHLAW